MAGLPPSEWTPVKETTNSAGRDDVPSNAIPVDPVLLEEPVFEPPPEACPFQNAPSFAPTQPSVVTVQPSFAPQPANQYYQQQPSSAPNQYIQPQPQSQPQAQQTPSQQMVFAARPATVSQTQPPNNFQQPTVVASMAQPQTTTPGQGGQAPPPNQNPFFFAPPPQQFPAMPAGGATMNWICSICGMNNTAEAEYCGNCQKVKTPLVVPPASMQQQMVMVQMPNGETVMMAAPQQDPTMMAIGPDGQMVPMFPPGPPPRQQLKLTFDCSPITCPHCGQNGRTKITRKPGLLSFISGGILCFGGCFIIAWVPCFLPPCQDVQHTCPHCHKLLGVRKRLG